MAHKRKRAEPIGDFLDTEASPKMQEGTTSQNDKIKSANVFGDAVNDRIKSANVFGDAVNDRIKRAHYETAPSGEVSQTINGGQQTSLFNSTISDVDSEANAIIAVDPHTPPYEPRSGGELQTPPSISTIGSRLQVYSPGRSQHMLEEKSGVTVDLELADGEYVLKIKKRSISSSSKENNKVEEAKQLAQNAGMLIGQAEMLRNMAEQMLSQYRESLSSVFRESVTKIGFTEQ